MGGYDSCFGYSPMDRVREGRRGFLARLTSGRWLAPAVVCCMTVTLLALFPWTVRRAFADVEVAYNEGWNAIRRRSLSLTTNAYRPSHIRLRIFFSSRYFTIFPTSWARSRVVIRR